MVLELSVDEIEPPDVIDYVPDLFNVHVDSKRILTVVTDDDGVASKWLTEVLRSKKTNTKPPLPGIPTTTFPPDSIFVGLVAEKHSPSFGPKPYDHSDYTVDLLTLCVGSHCLMFELPGSYRVFLDKEITYDAPKLVKAFFQNPRVVVLGTDMVKVSKRLAARHGIKIRNAVDLNQLAVKGIQRHDLDLARYDFEKLTMTVLGKEFDVIKPEKVYWYEKVAHYNCKKGLYYTDSGWQISSEKVMFTTVDAYLRLLMCFKLLEAIEGPRESSSSKKKNKKEVTKRIQPWVLTGTLRVSFKTFKLTTQVISGTTIVAFIVQSLLFFGSDTRATDDLGAVTRRNVNKLPILTKHIVMAMAGDGEANIRLLNHLRRLIRDYEASQHGHETRDKLGVKQVAQWALQYVKSEKEEDLEILIAGYEPTKRPYIFQIHVNTRILVSCTSAVIGSGSTPAKKTFDPQIHMRQSLSPPSAKLLALDTLIAGAVEDSATGDSLTVHQMEPTKECKLQFTRDVLEGYTERYNDLNLKPEREGRVLFVLLLSEQPVKHILRFFSPRRVSRCINVGPTLHNAIAYRVVFKDSLAAKNAYGDCCYRYETELRDARWGNTNPYLPFTLDLTLLEMDVLKVYIPSMKKNALVCKITSGEHMRILREVPFQNWPLSEEQRA